MGTEKSSCGESAGSKAHGGHRGEGAQRRHRAFRVRNAADFVARDRPREAGQRAQLADKRAFDAARAPLRRSAWGVFAKRRPRQRPPCAVNLSEQDITDLASYYAYLPRLPAYHPTPAVLQIASQSPVAFAFGWIRGRIMKPAIADTRKIAATIAIPGVQPGRLLHQHAGDIVMREAVVAPGKSQRGGQVGEFLGRRLTPHRASHSNHGFPDILGQLLLFGHHCTPMRPEDPRPKF